MSKRVLASFAVLPALALAACGDSPEGEGAGDADPATEQALNDQIMVDPDLARQNEGNAALTGGTDQSIPPENRTPEAIQAARETAAALVGGASAMKSLPEAKAVDGKIPETAALTAAARAAVSPGGENCAEQVKYSARWAAKLPAAFPVYPRGSTKEAAGTDMGDCALRVVSYLTPVPMEEVLGFYHTRALSGGYTSEHIAHDGDNIVSGTKGDASYVVYGRKLENGLTEIDLVTSGT